MNGTVIDIPGITVNVLPIDLQDSSDQSHILSIGDGKRMITIQVVYGNITQITNEEICCSKH